MRRKLFFLPILIPAFLAAISYVVMQLWNNLLPAILHVGVITFWQAMGIFILCKILFGFGKGGHGWGGFGGGAPWMRRKMEQKFNNMSPEERERFKQKMAERMCGGFGDHRRGGRFSGWDDFKTEAPKATE